MTKFYETNNGNNDIFLSIIKFTLLGAIEIQKFTNHIETDMKQICRTQRWFFLSSEHLNNHIKLKN